MPGLNIREEGKYNEIMVAFGAFGSEIVISLCPHFWILGW